MGIKIKPKTNEKDKKKTSKTEEAKNRKEERKIKRMEERTKRIGIRQGEKTRRVEARNQ